MNWSTPVKVNYSIVVNHYTTATPIRQSQLLLRVEEKGNDETAAAATATRLPT